MKYNFKREDVDFYSNGTRCSAWLYLPETEKRCPIIVMAHGLGGPRKCKRYKTIKVQWQTTEMQTRIKTFTGFPAQIIQHEVDHCDGILI